MSILFQIPIAIAEPLWKVQNTTILNALFTLKQGIDYFKGLNLGTDININFQLLTLGSQHFDNETNKSILLSVLRFLKDSHRFD